MTRTQLLHAQERWPTAISPFLWPYALRIANDEWNHAPNPRDSEKLTPLQRFSHTTVQRNIHHSAPFGCPTYILTSELQARLPFHKWKSRSNVGIYLRKLPLHARNVALVMDRNSGRVSPQYHIKFDIAFDTVRHQPLQCTWMTKAGFICTGPKSDEAPPESPPHSQSSSNDTSLISELTTALKDSVSVLQEAVVNGVRNATEDNSNNSGLTPTQQLKRRKTGNE